MEPKFPLDRTQSTPLWYNSSKGARSTGAVCSSIIRIVANDALMVVLIGCNKAIELWIISAAIQGSLSLFLSSLVLYCTGNVLGSSCVHSTALTLWCIHNRTTSSDWLLYAQRTTITWESENIAFLLWGFVGISPRCGLLLLLGYFTRLLD